MNLATVIDVRAARDWRQHCDEEYGYELALNVHMARRDLREAGVLPSAPPTLAQASAALREAWGADKFQPWGANTAVLAGTP